MSVKFDPAKEFKDDYEVRAHFYRLKGCSSVLRNILEINLKNPGKDVPPQAIVIMMNPGSAVPIEDVKIPEFTRDEIKSKDWVIQCLNNLVKTKPDLAQYQIMRLMRLKNWNFVRVLNLCDLKEARSSQVQSIMQEQSIDSSFISITSDDRHDELAYLIAHDIPIIAGWGRLPILKSFAEDCLRYLESKNRNVIGVKYDVGDPHLFKYPSPMRKSLKIAWLDQISKLF